ncbi:MAG TPA: carboxypeptidase-like regulatory domain-containing protein [Vicinamibacterales bacterium]|nr:carboxypeptidase-like regulatory domain-containing protein [Vicinamibacterales bacterium]
MRSTVRALTPLALAVAALATRGGTPLAAQDRQVMVMSSTVGGGPAALGGVPMGPVEQNGTGLIVGQVVDADGGRPIPGAVVAIGGAAGGGGLQFRAVTVGGGPPIAAGPGSQNPRVLSDSEGHFAFKNLPKGTFNITAQKPGYADGAYGRLRPSGSTQSIDLDDGERRGDLKVRLFKYAAITGTIVDDSNDPVVGATVRVYRRNLVAGRRVLGAAGPTAQTDDRGMYRLGNLTPGEYIVAAPTVQTSTPAGFQLQGPLPPDLITTLSSPGGGFSLNTGGTPVTPDGKFLLTTNGRTISPAGPSGRWMVYASQYYPSAPTIQQAVPIVVKSGEERSGVDMQLRLVPAVNIGGRLVGPDGPAANWGVHLVPGDTSDLSADPDVATSITDADGSFMFLAVPSGQYVIQTVRVPRQQPNPRGDMTVIQTAGGSMVFTTSVSMDSSTNTATPKPPPAPPDPTLWTATPISLGSEDVTDLTIALHTGFSLSGHFEFDGAATRPTPDRMAQLLVTAEPADGKAKAMTVPGRVDGQGNFTLFGLLPGKYLLRVGGAPAGWTYRSATLGGQDVSETPIALEERDLAGIVVTFTDAPTDLRGNVRTPDGAADDGSVVVVFPSDDRSWVDYGLNPRRVRLTRASKTGAYAFGALPPGEYYLVAFSDEFADEWQDPRFLDQLTRAATRVQLGDGDKRTQDLTRQNVRPAGGFDPTPAPSEPDTPSLGGPYVDEAAAPRQMQQVQVPPRDARPTPTPSPAAQPPARDIPLATTGTSVVSGTVLLDDGSEQPVRHARVTLRSTETRAERTTTTDDTGRFAITAVPAGHYTVLAQKPAFVAVYYGSKHPGRGPGTALTVADGQVISGVAVRMPRGGVITGRVFDDYGAPVPNASVRVLQYRSAGGEPTLQMFTTPGAPTIIQTDDRGVYRAYGLTPGSYVVSITPVSLASLGADLRQLSAVEMQAALAAVQQAGPPRPSVASVGGAGANGVPASRPTPGADATPPPAMPPPGRAVGYSTVYYPGTWSATDAQPVIVGAGQEVTGIDVPVRLVPTAKIEGTVLGADGQPVPGVSMSLIPVSQQVTGMVTFASIRTTPDGKFSSQNVAPGHYLLTARAGGGPPMVVRGGIPPGAPPPPPPPPAGGVAFGPDGPPAFVGQSQGLWAQQELDIAGEDLTGLTLVLQQGMTISGRVAFAGRTLAPPADLTKVSISLLPAGPRGIVVGLASVQVDASGGFTMTGVTPGKYRLSGNVPGSSPSSGWQLKSSVVEGHDTLDEPIDIKSGQNLAGAVLTFTDQMAELSGTLLDAAGKPTPGFTILVFSTNRAHWTSGSRRTPQPIQPASDGRFKVTGLAAGEYFLAAVTDMDPQDWGDPVFMEQVAAAAIKVTLGDGEKKVQDVRIAQ